MAVPNEATEVRLPLAGITVVSFEQAVALPFCTRLLADMGARVVKIEQPPAGDFTRAYDNVVNGMAAHFVWLNRNKESLSLNLRRPGALEVLHRLLVGTDVVLQNLAPGAAERLGIAAAQLAERYPRLVAVDISGYGTGGPYDHKRAYDLLIQAESGVCSITGEVGAPAKPGPPMADLGTGMHALTGVLAALVDRERTGRGAVLSVGMLDVMAEWMGFALQHTLHTGTELAPVGMGSPKVAPYGAFPTADGQTAVLGTTNNREWDQLARRMLERPDLAEDPRYASNEQRCAERDDLHAVIAEWTGHHTLAEVQAAADAAGIGNARYNTTKDVLVHPQLTERDRWVDVDSPVGPLSTLRPPLVAPSWGGRFDPIPGLGDDNDRILTGLGFGADEIEALRDAGAL